ncbi:hypothetical protein [Acetobacter oryzoeni]
MLLRAGLDTCYASDYPPRLNADTLGGSREAGSASFIVVFSVSFHAAAAP